MALEGLRYLLHIVLHEILRSPKLASVVLKLDHQFFQRAPSGSVYNSSPFHIIYKIKSKMFFFGV